MNRNLYLHAYTPHFPGAEMDKDAKNPTRDWQEIAADAGKETDPKKLNKLMDELLEALARSGVRPTSRMWKLDQGKELEVCVEGANRAILCL